MSGAKVESSYAWCQRLARRQAGNFYHAFRVLPRDQRRAMYALYAFMRVTDDLADGKNPLAVKRTALAAWRMQLRECLAGRSVHQLHPALFDTINRFAISPRYLEDVLDGVEMDLLPVRFDTFDQLYKYCYRVASAVGLACIRIWGYSNDAAKSHAEHAGIALQLTNILRDLIVDRANDRIYLPTEDLMRFHCPAERFGDVRNPGYRALMAFEIERARGYYQSAEPLADYLTRPGKAVFQVIVGTYRGVLEEIERRGYDVSSSPVRVSRWKKAGLVLKALPVRWGLTS